MTPEQIYRRALESIRKELTSFDPDGDDVNYDREQACIQVHKILNMILGPEPEEDEE